MHLNFIFLKITDSFLQNDTDKDRVYWLITQSNNVKFAKPVFNFCYSSVDELSSLWRHVFFCAHNFVYFNLVLCDVWLHSYNVQLSLRGV